MFLKEGAYVPFALVEVRSLQQEEEQAPLVENSIE
jgi:hypothetical protein